MKSVLSSSDSAAKGRVHRAVRDGDAVAPGECDELVSRQHAAAVPEEDAEQPPFLRGDVHRLPGAPQLAPVEIGLKLAGPGDARVRPRAAPELRPDRARSSRILNGFVT